MGDPHATADPQGHAGVPVASQSTEPRIVLAAGSASPCALSHLYAALPSSSQASAGRQKDIL